MLKMKRLTGKGKDNLKGTHMISRPASMKSSHHGAVEINQTRNHEVVSLIPGLTQWAKDLVLLSTVV